MASLGDIGLAAAINILSALIFLLAFAFLRLQPLNDRVYFPKWYLKGLRSTLTQSGPIVKKIVNLDWRAYIRFLNWVPDALKMPELELIDHAGLDSAVYLRIYLLGELTQVRESMRSAMLTNKTEIMDVALNEFSEGYFCLSKENKFKILLSLAKEYDLNRTQVRELMKQHLDLQLPSDKADCHEEERSTCELLRCWYRPGGNKIQKKWWKAIPGCIWWTIWRERNSRCFEDKSSTIQKIKMNCISSLYFWCKECFVEEAEDVLDLLESL